MSDSPPPVYLVDDDEAVGRALQLLLFTFEREVRVYRSAADLLDDSAALGAGILLTDVRMPQMSGLELIQRLKLLRRSWPIIVMTGHADIPLAVQAMRAGACDFLEKPFSDAALAAALARADELLASQDGSADAILAKLQRLSGREHDVLAGLRDGKTNKEIARDLGISPRSVETYRAQLMKKCEESNLPRLLQMLAAAEAAA